MGQNAVTERIGPCVAARVGACPAFGERQCQRAALSADAVFAVIEDTDTAGWLGQVGIAVIADLEHGLFARVVTGDGALDAAELCFTAGETRTHICMEGSLQQSMLFVPHKAAFPFHQRGVCAENGIRLVLFTAPLPSGYLYNTENYQSYVDALRNFCAAHDGLEYWDFSLYKLQSEINLKIEDFSDAHHLNGAGAEKFTAILCKTIQRRAAGESVDDLFYQTVEEKLTLTPDDSVLMAYYAKLQDE